MYIIERRAMVHVSALGCKDMDRNCCARGDCKYGSSLPDCAQAREKFIYLDGPSLHENKTNDKYLLLRKD